MRRAIIPQALAEAARSTGFSPAIRAGDVLYLTGATGGADDGTMPSTAADQTRAAPGKIRAVLTEAGATLDTIVEMTSYHTDIDRDFAQVQECLTAVFAAPLPAWTAVEVAKLRRPGAVVEFRMIAHHPDPGGH